MYPDFSDPLEKVFYLRRFADSGFAPYRKVFAVVCRDVVIPFSEAAFGALNRLFRGINVIAAVSEQGDEKFGNVYSERSDDVEYFYLIFPDEFVEIDDEKVFRIFFKRFQSRSVNDDVRAEIARRIGIVDHPTVSCVDSVVVVETAHSVDSDNVSEPDFVVFYYSFDTVYVFAVRD